MELIGEEKRIQGLFSEARFADEHAAPSFVAVWNGAQAKTVRPAKSFQLSFVVAAAFLVCAVVSLAWWSSHRQRRSDAVIANVPSITPETIQPVQPAHNPEPEKVARPGLSDRSRALKLAARRHAGLIAAARKTLRDAKAITSWQSPTATLLESPSDGLLKSLPQLNQTAEELKSFLRDQLNSRPK